MRLWALLLLTVLAGTRSVAADDDRPSENRVRALLASPRPLAAAWGLHYAIEGGMTAVGPEVFGLLERWQDDTTWAGGALRAAALDAALVLGLEVPAPLLRAVAPKVGDTTVLILAARDPAAYRDLLAPMLDRAQGNALWTAACNLLLPLRDAALVRHLLGRIELEAHVLVRDDVPEDWWPPLGSGRVCSSGTGCGQIPKPPVVGWPPRHGWTLTSTPDPEGRLVAPGREPIFAVRREWRVGGFSCVHSSTWSRDYDAEAYLAELLGADVSAFRSYLSEYTDVRFTGLQALAHAVTAAKAERQRAWGVLLAMCVLRDLLPPGDVLRLRPRIVVDVRDGRKVQDPPLPASLGK